MSYNIGDLVSAKVWKSNEFMPGVGEIIYIDFSLGIPIYYCDHNSIIYHYTEEQIYLYEPY